MTPPVTAAAARWIGDAVARDIRERSRRNGGVPGLSAEVAEALTWLEHLGSDGQRARSENGPPSRTLADVTGMEPAVVAANAVGCSDRHVRRLAASGRVRCRRLGAHGLLIDVDSLRSVLSKGSHG